MKKSAILSTTIATAFVLFFFIQVASVSAHESRNPSNHPITSPITSPTTCKPGWGFGDKNHCHSKFHDVFEKCIHLFDHHNDRDNHGHDRGHTNHH